MLYTKPYQNLRDKMSAMRLRQTDVAAAVNISKTEFSMKIMGYYPFTQDEIYDICDFLNIEVSEISYYFPRRTPEQRSFKRKRKKVEENIYLE